MKIYTKKGDTGKTTLFGGDEVYKDDIRIEAYGSIDELTSYLSLISAQIKNKDDIEFIRKIQKDLYLFMGILALANNPIISINEKLKYIEQKIDLISLKLPELKGFIIPGTNTISSYLHIARTVCRRAERNVVTLSKTNNNKNINKIIKYLNRLSDLLFTYARLHGEDILL